MPLLILLLNYLSVARGAPYLAALQIVIDQEPTLLPEILRNAVALQAQATTADSEAKEEPSMDEAKQEAATEGWVIIERARATGCMVISKEELLVIATDPTTCLEPVTLFFSDGGKLKAGARDAIDQLRLKVFRCELLQDDDIPPGIPIAMRTSWREAERKRLREAQEQRWHADRIVAEVARGCGLQRIRDSIARGCVLTSEDAAVIGADPETCTTELLVICGDTRVRTEARDCARMMQLLEILGEEYVVSVTARALSALGLSPVTDARGDWQRDADHDSVAWDPEHAAALAQHIAKICASLLQHASPPA
jgi:hypothetical protein